MANERVKARVCLEVDLGKLQSNFRKIAGGVAPLKVMPVLKANAYGLGVRPIAAALKAAGAAMFGVAELREAVAIEDLGVPVLILGGLLAEEVPQVVAHGITAAITDLHVARLLSAEAQRQGKVVQCHFKIDTGMGRLGIQAHEAESVITQVLDLPGLKPMGIYSHFPFAYEDYEFSERQVDTFLTLVERLARRGVRFEWVHMANSDGINNLPISCRPPFNLARTGINLYGVFDPEGKQTLALEPVLSMRTRLVAVRRMPAGSSIGYGRTCKLEHETRVGTISMGYADGMPIAMSNKGFVIVHDKHCKILGRVSMDYTTINLEHVPEAQVGDEVICLGQHITVGDWARAKGTIPYDIICSIGNRVERVHVGGEKGA